MRPSLSFLPIPYLDLQMKKKKNGFGAVASGREIKLGKSSLDELMTSRREREISLEFLSEVETSRTCVFSTQFQSSISP